MNTDNEKQVITIRGISIQIVKKNVKNLHISVLPPKGRVRITSPVKMNEEAIRMAIISRYAWIKKQQIKYQNQERQSIRECVSGESHYFLGKPYRLKVIEVNDKPTIVIKGKTQLVMQIPEDTTVEKRDKMMSNWYRSRLIELLNTYVPKWEKKMNIKVSKVGVRHMKTRWGSCNKLKNRIWLNTELIKKPHACIEYVLVHEFCHMIEKKHNDKFLELMDMYMPKWRMYKEELNRMPLAYEKWIY